MEKSKKKKNPKAKEYHSIEEWMREMFPKECERRDKEGRCILCGQLEPKPRFEIPKRRSK